jgi:hypothetical protein
MGWMLPQVLGIRVFGIIKGMKVGSFEGFESQ